MLNKKEQEQAKASAIFRHLADDDAVPYLQQCAIHSVSSGEALYETGSAATHLYVVLEGVILLLRGDAPNLAILSLREAGNMFGLTANICRNNHHSSARSMRSSLVLSVPNQAILDLKAEHPSISDTLLQALATNTHDIASHFERLRNLKTSARLADYLLTRVRCNNGPAEFTLPCDKGIIASYLGMERESFSRALKKLRAVGVSSHGRKIILEDVSALRHLRTENVSIGA